MPVSGTMLCLESWETRNDSEPSRSFLIRIEDLLELMDRLDVGKRKG